MGMLDELLYIKTFREGQAETAMLVSRAHLAEAHRQESNAQQELSRFQAAAREDELSWYRSLCQRIVRPQEIADVQLDVAILRAEEQARAESLAQAEQQRAQAQTGYTDANEHLREASATRNKFEELASQHNAAERREQERREEQELEEVAGNPRRRDDDDPYEP
jgi:type III secretion protein O